MKLFCTWCRLHKIKFTLLVLYALACAAMLRFDVVWGLVVMAIGYGAWAVIYTIDTSRFLSLLLAASLLSVPSARAQTNETYTVKVGDINGSLLTLTNVVRVQWYHEPGCTLVTHIVGSSTNEFHAWRVPVFVTTNKVNKAEP